MHKIVYSLLILAKSLVLRLFSTKTEQLETICLFIFVEKGVKISMLKILKGVVNRK